MGNKKHIESILESINGMHRAQVPNDLFDKILLNIENLNPQKVKVISMKALLVAASMMFLINAIGLFKVTRYNDIETTPSAQSGTSSSLISNYKIYDYE